MPHPVAEQYGKDIMECYSSLIVAIDKCGGSIPEFEDIKKMTIEEFILGYGHNGIRFYYLPKKQASIPEGGLG